MIPSDALLLLVRGRCGCRRPRWLDEHAAHAHTHTGHAHADQPSQAEPADIHENSIKAVTMIFSQMINLANQMAIRVHTHIILSYGKVDYVYHAQEAVRLAERGRQVFGPGKTPESRAAVENLLIKAREALRKAERDLADCQRVREGLKAGTIKKPKKGCKIIYGGDHLDAQASGAGVQPDTQGGTQADVQSDLELDIDPNIKIDENITNDPEQEEARENDT